MKRRDSDSEDDIDLTKAVETAEKDKKNQEKVIMDVDESDEIQPRTTRSRDKLDNKDIKKLLYKKLGKHYLADEVRKSAKEAVLTAAAYHQDTRILVVGFSNGSFFLYEIPEVNMIHSLRYLQN